MRDWTKRTHYCDYNCLYDSLGSPCAPGACDRPEHCPTCRKIIAMATEQLWGYEQWRQAAFQLNGFQLGQEVPA